MTTMFCRAKDGNYARLHVIHNRKTHNTLAISFSDTDFTPPRGGNLTLVTGNRPDALPAIEGWLNKHAAGQAQALGEAFAFRNQLPGDSTNLPIAQKLIHRQQTSHSPVMIRAGMEPAPQSWAERANASNRSAAAER
jgi:hypothetical protein